MPPPRADAPFPRPPDQSASPATIRAGEIKFTEQCSRCHVFGPSVTPDLRKLNPALHKAFNAIVLRGILSQGGMASFADVVTPAEANAIHAYLIDQSWQAYRAQSAASH
jgi:quinohemoprotein ethanol dehydrogenase